MQAEKSLRHRKITELIDRQVISSQEELRQALTREGMEVTQATLSRDLRELGVIKQTTEEGIFRYGPPDAASAEASILRCEVSGNLIVLRTSPGMAPVYAYRIDNLKMESILGTVAGEDTLFAVVAETFDATRIKDELCKRLKGR